MKMLEVTVDGHPLHPALVAVPIGAWIASFVFDIASHLVGDPGFLVTGARWLIGIGVLGAVAAALAGVLDLLTLRAGTRVFRVAVTHMAINGTVVVAYAIGFLWRATSDQAGGEPVGWGPLALSAASLAGLTAGGYLGGELAYRYGVRVAAEAIQQHTKEGS
ncbi:DUF2231 domain-containing protein [Actinoplanes aureus]|jgi:uncharacterized membrane protein|uniref:DUF2231 domain-containing protein n=1 Tax=Actinoplanes aureus TaxID=2792083 RepID=A0A931G399_9ACTN|nr:DUF2231 domain-containing protein [Actinoplanes aureus]MBG0564059.1 DUF2231 domain-containing protein [Actinoplanes aureus]